VFPEGDQPPPALVKPHGRSIDSRRVRHRRQFLPPCEVEKGQMVWGPGGQDPRVTNHGVKSRLSGRRARPPENAQLMPRGDPEEPDLASLAARADQGAVRAEARADVVLRGQQESARDRVPKPATPGPVPTDDPVAGGVERQVDPLSGVPDPARGAEGARLGVPEENGSVAGAGKTPAVRVPGDAGGPGVALR